MNFDITLYIFFKKVSIWFNKTIFQKNKEIVQNLKKITKSTLCGIYFVQTKISSSDI